MVVGWTLFPVSWLSNFSCGFVEPQDHTMYHPKTIGHLPLLSVVDSREDDFPVRSLRTSKQRSRLKYPTISFGEYEFHPSIKFRVDYLDQGEAEPWAKWRRALFVFSFHHQLSLGCSKTWSPLVHRAPRDRSRQITESLWQFFNIDFSDNQSSQQLWISEPLLSFFFVEVFNFSYIICCITTNMNQRKWVCLFFPMANNVWLLNLLQ